MRMLGVIGGMSWESTLLYYRLLNQGVAARLGGLHSARLLLHSVDFAPLAAMQAAADWDGAAAVLADAACGLRAPVPRPGAGHQHHAQGGAGIEAVAGLPLLHIADATGAALVAAGVRRAGLLGTRFTMDDASIVQDRLRERFGLQLLLPAAVDRAEVHRVIYEELCRGVVADASRAAYRRIIAGLGAHGAAKP
jgi:aspartate racemase